MKKLIQKNFYRYKVKVEQKAKTITTLKDKANRFSSFNSFNNLNLNYYKTNFNIIKTKNYKYYLNNKKVKAAIIVYNSDLQNYIILISLFNYYTNLYYYYIIFIFKEAQLKLY